MANVLEEVLRIVLETQGQEGLDKLRDALGGVGDVADETIADTKRLVDTLTELNATAGKAARFQQMTDDLEEVTQALDHASREAIQLKLELAEQEKPSKAAERAYKSLRDEVDRLEAKQKQLATAQDKVGKELREAGVDTNDLANANKSLRTQIEGTTSALKKQAQVVEEEAKSTRKNKEALQESDAAFRKLIQSGNASAEALKRYREGADGAAAGSRNLADQGGRLSSVFGSLRSLIAPVLAYLSFDAARDGLKNLAGVAAGAENARRALQNLYGTTEAGNRAYEQLRDMAKQSGLAFSDLVDDAKKLKAFGLDPLNGSLQALIDQNAAVGGSQQDLSGKVLALGQAWAKQKLQGEEILQLVERGVPVWSLLEKATGKNVQELQKLSEAGKLGRDVIQKLYEEIGRANTGAAERGLSSLSGLLAQASARWQDFMLKVADSGVTEYLKKQLDALLGSTSNMDAVAKKVADGVIGMLEALRRLGSQLAPVGAAVGNLTLFLARHAEVVLGMVKAWALFRAAEIVIGFGSITNAVTKAATAIFAETAATTANTAAKRANAAATAAGAAATTAGATATVASAAAATGLLGVFQALGQRIMAVGAAAARLFTALGVPAAVLATVYALTKAYEGVVEANNKLWLSQAQQRSQQQDQLRLGQQLQQMYRDSAATAIESGEAVGQMSRDQANDYKFALEQARLYYRGVINEAIAAGDAVKLAGARERMDELGQAVAGVTAHLEGLKAAADPKGLIAFVDGAVGKFDELVNKSKSAKEAIAGIFDGLDLTRAEGIRQASEILSQITARGTDAGKAIRNELSAALSKVSIEDLPKLKVQAEAAMAAGVAGAKDFSDAIATVGLQRLGVDIEAIRTGFTAAGRSAVEAFKLAADEVNDLGLTVEQRSQAMAQAFDNAFKQASTKAELAALKAAIQDALSAGDIGFAEFEKRVVQVDAKLEGLSNTGKKVGDGVAEGASKASTALSNMGTAASSAASGLDKTTQAAGQANKTTKEGEGLIKSYALAWDGMNDAAARALVSLNKYLVNGMTGTHSLRYKLNVERLTAEMQKQLETVRKLTAAANEQNAAYDENEQKLIRLRQQYKWLAEEELQALIDAEQRLEENRKRAADEARQRSEEAIERYREQGEAAAEAAKEAAESGSVLTGRSNPGAIATAEAAGELAEAATAISRASSSVAASEVVLRVIAEPTQGVAVVLSKQQIDDIAAAVIRTLSLAKSMST